MEPLDYDANKYLIVTISDPSALRDVHPAITHVGQVGQLKDLHRLKISNRDWDNERDAILESLREVGVSRIDHDKLQQRSRRQDEF
jgi:hypothetical protein